METLVIASRIEIFAGAVLEALAHGSPTVATAVGGSTEVIRDGADGVLVPADDAEALAGGIARLLDDPARAAALGDSGNLGQHCQSFLRIFSHRGLAGKHEAVGAIENGVGDIRGLGARR